MKLLDAATATVTGTDFRLPQRGEAQERTVYVNGTPDTATINLEMSPDGGTTWMTVGSWTSTTATNVNFAGDRVRGTLTSAGTSTNVNLWLE